MVVRYNEVVRYNALFSRGPDDRVIMELQCIMFERILTTTVAINAIKQIYFFKLILRKARKDMDEKTLSVGHRDPEAAGTVLLKDLRKI